MTSEKGCRKDKNQNIQVFVRLRPLNQRERDIKSIGVVDVVNNREVVVRQSQQTSLTKKFTFDKAFGPSAKQVEVYQDVVSPLIEEVLAGYNCTVFAYGQTGTGKTHTMVGENSGDEATWQTDPLAGIIPRSLSQLFDELRISNTEYTVRVSYLELYNEELFDLLSSSEDNSKLRIYEDVTRKGSNIVNGLEEITVYNKNEVYKIMAQGQERKRVASTLMNAQSSRSHTVFTIVVHMKENSPEGEELVKIGKLNLVDLAGSENISKAGSDNPAKRERARECVNINQSLLTLGRVITALVERHPHIPYRESKLTRILQESLGGRTKTSIIATISPGHKDLEETMSTLEYAHRAKNIQNKPEINQKMTKKAILKEYAEEIDRLKRDLQAAREKNGIYLATETYSEMTLKQEEQRKEIQELLLRTRAMEEERDKMEKIFSLHNKQLKSELDTTRNNLNKTKEKLINTHNLLKSTSLEKEEQKHLVSKQQETERMLSETAQQLISAADVVSTHVANLHDSVDKRRMLEKSNLMLTKTLHEESSQHRDEMVMKLGEFTDKLTDTLQYLQNSQDKHLTHSTQTLMQNKQKLEEVIQIMSQTVNDLKSLTISTCTDLRTNSSKYRTALHSVVSEHMSQIERVCTKLVRDVDTCVNTATRVDLVDTVNTFVQQWRGVASERVTCARGSHAAFETRVRTAASDLRGSLQSNREARNNQLKRREEKIQKAHQKLEEKKSRIETRINKQLENIQTDKRDLETRLTEWAEKQRKHLELRIKEHIANETEALTRRNEKKIAEIEELKKELEEMVDYQVEFQNMVIVDDKNDAAEYGKDLEGDERGVEGLVHIVNDYGKEWNEGMTAISADIDALQASLAHVVGAVSNDMMRGLQETRDTLRFDVSEIVTTDKKKADQLTNDTDYILENVLTETKQAMDTIVNNVESTTSSTVSHLNTLCAAAERLVSESSSHLASHSLRLGEARGEAETFHSELCAQLNRQAELEGRYLMHEYSVYTPTGNTPVRQEYRYPRTVAATSPHDRILARFRAMRHEARDEDIICIESEPEPSPSDCESSTSEDSVIFAAPSPPDNASFNGNRSDKTRSNTSLNGRKELANGHPLVKSTSETSIYIQRKNGKENTERSVSQRKPSKLPGPASQKKPLVERNDF